MFSIIWKCYKNMLKIKSQFIMEWVFNDFWKKNKATNLKPSISTSEKQGFLMRETSVLIPAATSFKLRVKVSEFVEFWQESN